MVLIYKTKLGLTRMIRLKPMTRPKTRVIHRAGFKKNGYSIKRRRITRV